MRKSFNALTALILCTVSCTALLYSQVDPRGNKFQEKQVTNYVPTEKVACEIAVIILTPIYGEEKIKKQMPFKATLVGDTIWVVEGVQKELAFGGTAYIEIQKRDCKILKVTHEK